MMAPTHDETVIGQQPVVRGFEEDYGPATTGAAHTGPANTILRIIAYLRDNDATRDPDWGVNFPLIQSYLADAHQHLMTDSLGSSNPTLRTALKDARAMLEIHLESEARPKGRASWPAHVLPGSPFTRDPLVYPHTPIPDQIKSSLWGTIILDATTGSPVLADIDDYIKGENDLFQRFTSTGGGEATPRRNNNFEIENKAYEKYMGHGPAGTWVDKPPAHHDAYTDPKSPTFYERRGWRRAALQQCLNLFTSEENRVINTPWRRSILPYQPSEPLPGNIIYAPRAVEASQATQEGVKDPFAWLHLSFQYTRIVDYLAECQRRSYKNQFWNDFTASELPINFRGPRIYRGLAVHDRHWLELGEELEMLENTLHGAWGAAPRPLIRAILRDIDSGRRENTGGPNMDNSRDLPSKDDDDMQDRKRYWRRDIKRRLGIDNRQDNTNDDNFTLLAESEISWLKYLCEPSRTLEMCDPSTQPTHNLAILFDAKLQSYFRNLTLSGTPDSKALSIWAEGNDDINEVKRSYEPNALRTVLAYINGCTESDLQTSGNMEPNPGHPNASYQFSLEEAEFLCIELQRFGRCKFIPKRGGRPARIDRPDYNVHPEDRVVWRHANPDEFRKASAQYLDDMVNHYHNSYGDWSLYTGDRLRLSRELEFMLDHTGSDFPIELERVEVQQKEPGTNEAVANRQAFIKQYLIPEGFCKLGDPAADEPESERGLPRRSDLASWDVLGKYLTGFHKQHNEQHINYYYSEEPYQPQTPEKTVQFFRNLAYRMGRTMRYVGHIKERLQYLENAPQAGASKPPPDLSAEPKQPRPGNNIHETPGLSAIAVEKWWHAIPIQDYDIAIEKWSTTVREGSGEMALLPPDAQNVLAEIDPDFSFQGKLKGEHDPFTVIREGIIDDCFQNRPTMYPTRLSGFKDQEDKAYQGYERPNLFVWATKTQRRYQAYHTRRSFFNMKRWPPSLLPPHKLEAIRERKDEIARVDPSKPDQAYGILTYRLPVGNEKPLYARPIVRHCTERDHDLRDLEPYFDADSLALDGDIETISSSNNNNQNNIIVNNHQISGRDHNNNTVSNGVVMEGQDSDTRGGVKAMTAMAAMTGSTDSTIPRMARRVNRTAEGKKPQRVTQRLIPFAHSDEKFVSGPAIFPFGDTLLQKISFSEDLKNVLDPERPFYRDRLFGLSRLWQSLTSAQGPSIPSVPSVARSNIPRSNPMKRTMPIEFLNISSATKKYRSDIWAYPEPGSSGGQFGAAHIARQVSSEKPGGGGTPATPVTPRRTRTPVTPSRLPRHKAATPVTPRRTRTDMTGPYPTPVSAARQSGGASERKDIPTPVTPSQLPRYIAASARSLKNTVEEAEAQFVKTFSGGWISTPTELQHMYTTALRALEFSINHQLVSHGNVRTSQQELKALVQTANIPELGIRNRNIFDVDAAGDLLRLFGDKHNMKLQLGVTQQENNRSPSSGTGPAKYIPNLINSRYSDDPDKIIVWVRLVDVERFPDHWVSAYSNLTYNCYKGIRASVR